MPVTNNYTISKRKILESIKPTLTFVQAYFYLPEVNKHG